MVLKAMTVAALMMFGATAARADEADARAFRCEQLQNYWQCQQYGAYGCRWDQWNGCRSQVVDRRCVSFRSQYQCQQNGCFWDYAYGCSANGNGGGGGGRQQWECEARDDGWEEHWNGHVGQGNTQNQAGAQAIASCQRPYGPHDRCYVTSCQRIR